MKIFSEEWVEAFGKAINDNPNYKPSALTWEGDMLFVIEPSGNLDHTVKVLVGLYHGECTGTKLIKEGEEVEAEFIITGNYDNVLQVIKKEIDPIRAIMAGKLKLEGNMAKVMRHTKAAQEIVVSLGNIETEFL
ncbi:MAG: SCP2 sterol-binding domain-containing protein [Candidatus Thorarchaeota archaeon]